MAKIIMVAGLAFGDEGKGSIVDYLTRVHGAKDVIRFTGGAQAAHNIVLPDGTHHTFSQFGSGSLAGARTYLSEHVLVNPLTLMTEWESLSKLIGGTIRDWMIINFRALITNRYHVAANRIRETVRGDTRHGSCGMGIGETAQDHIEHPELDITMSNLCHVTSSLREKLQTSRELKLSQLEADIEKLWEMPDCEARQSALGELNVLQSNRILGQIIGRYEDFGKLSLHDTPSDDMLKRVMKEASEHQPVIFEGAQGILLDETLGFHPYTTWTNTTWDNAVKICTYHGQVNSTRRIGVVRTYYTRHGAGPFPSESKELLLDEKHNKNTLWQQAFRVGHFDKKLLRYGTWAIGGLTEVALTHMDQWNDSIRCVYSYTNKKGQLIEQPFTKSRKPPLELQAEITENLQGFEAHTLKLMSLEDLIGHIEDEISVPVTIGSWGPTCADKRYLK